MSKDVYSAADVINTVFSGISVNDMQNAQHMSARWKDILVSITGCGQKLADHSKIIDLKNGVLLIETDHPGWIQLFEMHRAYILKGLKMKIPMLEIKSLSYRLKGARGELHGGMRDLTREEMEAAVEKQCGSSGADCAVSGEKKRPESAENAELPPELKTIFDRFKKSMLTNKSKM
ncbi:DciA family protein [Treponema brennaborense]|uniref:DUF721 domain-containing protein n=1 Tax=Treponema brennaborense (strain DSM 12168 / CIP 105900 / DD5/3) TaxID=906968 RepID=F4LK75_TREBD|nr:DciA family protein [Treponema brennaborense]AEE15464.1 protein of unknown function DUF721 [Treponema brennaborense DSM 12168]